jgi:two-component system chemotaxis sensor kinase CheA
VTDQDALERRLAALIRGAEDLLDALRSGTLLETGEVAASLTGQVDTLRAAPPEHPSLLLATGAGGAHLAVPVGAVRRLEQFAHEQLQRSGDTDVIRYGDSILPVLRLEELLGGGHPGSSPSPTSPQAGLAQMIVCDSSAGLLGLVVKSIEDVVPEPAEPAQPSSVPGVARRLVIDDRLTELLDLEALVGLARRRGHSL